MNKINFTIDEQKRQQSKRNYLDEIEKYLPKNLDESAKEHKALLRKREVKSASGLLQMLLIYAVSQISFKMLSFSAASMEVAEMSDKAWQKRMANSVNWLRYILNCILQTTVKKAEPFKRNINLFDASTVCQEGNKKTTVYIRILV